MQSMEVHSEVMGPRALRGASRVLQQAASANVTVVTTAEKLMEAVDAGDPHIEIRAHLNLTTLDPIDTGDGEYLLGTIPSTVRSIRVRHLLLLPTAWWLGAYLAASAHEG